MYTKLLVSFYVLIFGINCALVGIVMHQYRLVILSIANIVALFVILFQHSTLFVSVLPEERVLFSREVFGRLSLWFGIVGTYLYIPYQGSDTFFLYMLILGGIFYLLSVGLFTMAPKKYRSRWYINALIILIIVALLRTQSARISRTYGDDLVGVKNTIATQLQRSWKSIVDAFTPAPDMDTLPDASLTPNNEGIGVTTGILPSLGNGIGETGSAEITPPEKLFATQGREGQILTYSTFLPELVTVYKLSAPSSSPVFAHVPPTSSLYEPYRIAYAKRMIGSYTLPASELKCKHVMVLLGLAEGWTVTPSETIFAAYWKQAQAKGYLLGACTDMENLAHWEDLP